VTPTRRVRVYTPFAPAVIFLEVAGSVGCGGGAGTGEEVLSAHAVHKLRVLHFLLLREMFGIIIHL